MTDNMAALRYLLSAYFHQDYDLDGGESSDTVTAFLRERSSLTLASAAQIDQLLGEEMADGDLKLRLKELGSQYRAGDTDADYRDWLIEVRDQIRAGASA